MSLPFPTHEDTMIILELGHRTVLLENNPENRKLTMDLLRLPFYERVYSADYKASAYAPANTVTTVTVTKAAITDLDYDEASDMIRTERQLAEQAKEINQSDALPAQQAAE